MFIYQLLRPFSYLTIKHPDKGRYDWVAPCALTAISTSVLLFLLKDIDVFSNNGLIAKISDFVGILPGFYIAALAAIATFQRNDIDRYMPEPTPKMKIRLGNQENDIKLTRRRFLCVLFAFLTAESILISVVSIFALILAPYFSESIPSVYHVYCVSVFLIIYLFVFWQMIVATALGLYYLGDRLNQPD